MSRAMRIRGTWFAAAVVAWGTVPAGDQPRAARENNTIPSTVTIQIPKVGNVITGLSPRMASAGLDPLQGAAGEHWVGLLCVPVGDALRAHLPLAKGLGLLVKDVVAGSPAAKAGLKQHDVLVRFGNTDLKDNLALSKAIENAKTSAARVEMIRAGKKQFITVSPAKRPANDKPRPSLQSFLPDGPPLSPQVLALLRKATINKDGVLELRVVGPGLASVPRVDERPKSPEKKSQATRGPRIVIHSRKLSNGRIRVFVTRGQQSWETTDDRLEILPADIRARVEKALGCPTLKPRKFQFDFTVDGRKIGPDNHAVWVQHFPACGLGTQAWAWAGGGLAGGMPVGVQSIAGRTAALERKLEELNQKLDVLQKAIESLKKK